ncbi:SIR2 family NAD-dependent protein deacylase [Arsenicicoccus dermatophilus]|uniref:SIR2 family NAD-dependent protein deacylase n=1 Tax=Arsenicicoccus dermatophilus TaxID=1076331 RepID=UPI0039173EF5
MTEIPVPPAVLDLARAARRVVVLTGAGMSAESGVPTFRDAQSGLWERFDPAELATPDAWARDAELVWAWYAWRAALVRAVKPNAGHRALARWADGSGTAVEIVTQNVDDLHERAGSGVLAHVHGSLFAPRCESCSRPGDLGDLPVEPVARLAPPRCRSCGGRVRPGVVWFGEMLPEGPLRRAEEACRAADLVLVVGTSGLVWPAAGLPLLARDAGVPTVEINPAVTDLSGQVEQVWRATAAEALPALVDAVLGAQPGAAER